MRGVSCPAGIRDVLSPRTNRKARYASHCTCPVWAGVAVFQCKLRRTLDGVILQVVVPGQAAHPSCVARLVDKA